MASKVTWLRTPACFSIFIFAFYFFTSYSDILNSLQLLAFAGSRPLHMLLHISICSLIYFCINSLVTHKIDSHWYFSGLVPELLSVPISAPGTWKRLCKLIEWVKRNLHFLYSDIWKFGKIYFIIELYRIFTKTILISQKVNTKVCNKCHKWMGGKST